MSNYVVHRARLKYYSKIRNIKQVQIVKNVQLCEQIEQVAARRAESASQTEVLNWEQERFPVSVFGSVELNRAGGEAGQAHPASSCPPRLPWGPVYSQSRMLISLSSLLVCTWISIVCFVSSGLFALRTKAGKKNTKLLF